MTNTPTHVLEAESAFADDDLVSDLRAKYQAHPKRKKLPKFPQGDLTWKQLRTVAQKMDVYYAHTITRGLDGEEVEQAEVADFTKLTEIDKSFFAALASVRVEAGLSQAELAEQLGISVGEVNRVETGEPTLSLIQKYAAALGLTYSHDVFERVSILEDNREMVEETLGKLAAAGREKDAYRLSRILLQSYQSKTSTKTKEDLEELLASFDV